MGDGGGGGGGTVNRKVNFTFLIKNAFNHMSQKMYLPHVTKMTFTTCHKNAFTTCHKNAFCVRMGILCFFDKFERKS